MTVIVSLSHVLFHFISFTSFHNFLSSQFHIFNKIFFAFFIDLSVRPSVHTFIQPSIHRTPSKGVIEFREEIYCFCLRFSINHIFQFVTQQQQNRNTLKGTMCHGLCCCFCYFAFFETREGI